MLTDACRKDKVRLDIPVSPSVYRTMWSLAATLLELFLGRTRLRVESTWERPASARSFDLDRTTLRIDVVNPVDHEIPVERVLVASHAGEGDVTNRIRGEDPTPPCVIPARDRATWQLPLLALVEALLAAENDGRTTFQVAVCRATGRRDWGPRHVLDLEPLRTWAWVVHRSTGPIHRRDGEADPRAAGSTGETVTGTILGRARAASGEPNA
jgi:hypothetical protein